MLGEQITVDAAATGAAVRVAAKYRHHLAANIALKGFVDGNCSRCGFASSGHFATRKSFARLRGDRSAANRIHALVCGSQASIAHE
jgi:hypothetical protein